MPGNLGLEGGSNPVTIDNKDALLDFMIDITTTYGNLSTSVEITDDLTSIAPKKIFASNKDVKLQRAN